jgi:membrane-associated protease RseP (regulator of RpoE activity)
LLDILDISRGVGAPARPWPEGSDGSYVGIGIAQTARDGKIVITDAMADGPAARAGLQALDVIVGIGDRPVEGLPEKEVSELLKGAAGEPVKLVISRPGAAEPLTFTVVRERIPPDAQVLVAEYPNPKFGKRAVFVIDRRTALVEVEDRSELSKVPLPKVTNPLLLLRGVRNMSRRMGRLVSDEGEVERLRQRFDGINTRKWALYGLKSRRSR